MNDDLKNFVTRTLKLNRRRRTGGTPVTTQGLTIAVVGLGFGEQFVPIYLSHPAVSEVVLVERDPMRLRAVGDRYGIADRYLHIEDVLRDPGVDAVHVLAPVPLHADLSVRVLESGKHCACAVPMATTLKDIDRIMVAQAASGRNYMMMETSVCGREYLTVERMYRDGDFGPLSLYRGFHIQNLDGYPDYWQGYPPMHYLTHALSPALALLETAVSSVQARGAGKLTPKRRAGGFDNQYPAEVGLFTLTNSDALVEITMAFFQTARSYQEGFSLYGERRGIEWPHDNEGDMTQYDMFPPREGTRGNTIETSLVTPEDFPDLLPPELRQYTKSTSVQFPGMKEPVLVGADHGGSHPHLVHEFVSSIVERRTPRVDVIRSAEWTAPGICAHGSALEAGRVFEVPAFR